MARQQVDARGVKCPVPTLMMTNALIQKKVAPGDTMVVLADCPTFEADVRKWCQSMKKVLVVFKADGSLKTAEIRI